MGEPTSTRKVLRRAIGRAARMDFFRRYNADEVALTGTPTSTALYASSLTQEDNFWKNGWAYIASGTRSGESARITAFTASTDLLALEGALTGAPLAGDKLEIYELWPPSVIHQAINRSIEMAGRGFVDTVVDKTLVLCENKLRYSLTGLTKRVYRLNHVWVERQSNYVEGTIDAISNDGTDYTFTDTSLFTADDTYNGQKITLYAGTGAGDIGTVDDTAASTHTIKVTMADFTVAPAVGDKFRVWDENYQQMDLYEVRQFRLDAFEFPDTLALEMLIPMYYGCRLWLEYSSLPQPLTTDTDTTIVPQEYIIRKTLALLHDYSTQDNRADTQRHQQLAQYFHQQADDFLARYYTQRPSSTLPIQTNPRVTPDLNDPLDWHN